jgi:hypothetical protein
MKLLNIFSLFAIAILISLLLVIETLYWYGLKALPENTTPSSSLYSKDLLYAQWVELGGSSDIKMQKMYPETFFIESYLDRNYGSKSSRLALRSARHLLNRHTEEKAKRPIRGHLYTLAVGFWVSQNWTAEEALNTVLDSNYYGKQLFGIRAAAKVYFKKMPNELTQDEIIFLIALSTAPSYYTPCYPKQFLERVNYLGYG